MAPSDDARVAPELIRVPAPPLKAKHVARPFLIMGAVLAGLCLVDIMIAMSAQQRPGGAGSRLILGLTDVQVFVLIGVGGLLSTAVILALIWSTKRRAARAGLDRLNPDMRDVDPNAHPVASELSGQWTRPGRPPKPESVLATLARFPDAQGDRARVVFLGYIDPPQVGDLFFEPEVISPTHMYGEYVLPALVALLALAVWIVLQVLGLLKLPYVLTWFPFTALGTVLGIMGCILCVWFWRTWVRPTYIRVAPGIVEIVRYAGLRQAAPTIRRYPIEAGTSVIIHAPQSREPNPVLMKKPPSALQKSLSEGVWQMNLKITLVRGENTDVIRFKAMRDTKRTFDRIVEAILSTARAPEMDPHSLVG